MDQLLREDDRIAWPRLDAVDRHVRRPERPTLLRGRPVPGLPPVVVRRKPGSVVAVRARQAAEAALPGLHGRELEDHREQPAVLPAVACVQAAAVVGQLPRPVVDIVLRMRKPTLAEERTPLRARVGAGRRGRPRTARKERRGHART